jgi:predicted DNA-binding antitoxin AbrB/MazE fold protein
MTAMTVKAVYQNGVIKPLEPVQLTEGASLWVTVEPVQNAQETKLAAAEPWGAFPQLDLSFETIEKLTLNSWQPRTESLLHSLVEGS